MAEITPYKIATRLWSAETMGESSGTTARSLVSTVGLNANEIYKGINPSVLNHSAADKPNYIVPNSRNDGAVPDSFMPNGDKCVTQAYLDSLYTPKYLNFTTNIQHNTNSPNGSYLVSEMRAYQITVDVEYENISYGSSNSGIIKPISSNIYTALSVEIRFEYYRQLSYTSEPVCYCIKNFTIPVDKTIGVIKSNLFTSYNGISPIIPGDSTIVNPTGEVNEQTFMYYHLKSMFDYFTDKYNYTSNNGGFYSIKIKVSPEYAFIPNTLYEPQHYIAENIITVSTWVANGGSDYNDNKLMCYPNYNMTSGPSHYVLTPGITYTWNFEIVVNSFVPSITTTPENYITLSNYKGAESMEINASYYWNSTKKELTIIGSVVAVPSTTNPPSIKFEYKKTGYQSYVTTFPVNMTLATPAE